MYATAGALSCGSACCHLPDRPHHEYLLAPSSWQRSLQLRSGREQISGISGSRLGVRLGSDANAPKWRQASNQRTSWGGPTRVIRDSFATQRFDDTSLRRREQLRKHSEVGAAGGGELECGVIINPDHMSTWRQPQLTLAGEQHIPGFMFLAADQGVLAVGPESPPSTPSSPRALLTRRTSSIRAGAPPVRPWLGRWP